MHDSLVVAFEVGRIVTVWHKEPGRGNDSGDVCKQFHRAQNDLGEWHYVFHHGWKFHVHHWRIQVHALQRLRRRLLTRCEWCGGRDAKGDPVNVHSGDKIKVPWWKGARNTFHHDCSGVPRAKLECLCDDPLIATGGSFGMCAVCGKHRYGRIKSNHLAVRRLYATVPDGERPSDEVLDQIAAAADPGTVTPRRGKAKR